MYFIHYYLFNPDQRLYWGYLLSAAVLSVLYFLWRPQTSLQFLDMQSVKTYWLHPSALLDYRYFIVVWLIKLYIIAPLVLSAQTIAIGLYDFLCWMHASAVFPNVSSTFVMVSYTLSLFLVGEVSRYWLHRWLHTVPWLWQFHKVHHSAEVLNPVTFYRVHPIENFLFGMRYAISAGVVTGLCLWLFGRNLSIYMIGGANATVALFAFIGGNLRHSHIYLRYPAWLEHIFISPAQHQLHHSHRYAWKNFGGYLAIWDTIFGSLRTSANIEKPKHFGFPKAMSMRYQSVMRLFYQPFIDCFALGRKHHVTPKPTVSNQVSRPNRSI